MRLLSRFVLVVFLVGIFSGCKQSVSPAVVSSNSIERKAETSQPELLPAPSPDVDHASVEFQSRLEKDVPNMLEKHKVPGAAIGLVRGGQVMWVQGYGLANISSRRPVTPDTVFRVASISKPVAAWGVLHLVEQGKIDLQAPVERYLTRWRFPPSPYNAGAVTVFRLLSHTAGTNIHGYGSGYTDCSLSTIEQSLAGVPGRSEGVRIVQEPGSGYRYSGGGYSVLQLMIEEVSGERFATFMQNQILDPLEMTSSSYSPSPEVVSRMATAYDMNLSPLQHCEFTEKAAAGLYTTAADLAHFITAGLSGPGGQTAGRGILRPETVNLMYTPSPESGGQYGLGYQTYFDGTRIVFHGGDNPGWESTFTILPDLGEGLVSLTNSDGGEDFNAEMTQMWIKWLMEVYST